MPAAIWPGSSTVWLKTEYVETIRAEPIRISARTSARTCRPMNGSGDRNLMPGFAATWSGAVGAMATWRCLGLDFLTGTASNCWESRIETQSVTPEHALVRLGDHHPAVDGFAGDDAFTRAIELIDQRNVANRRLEL